MNRHRLQTILRRELFLKLGVIIAVLVTAMTVVLTVDNLLVSFVLAFVTNYLLSPIVDFLERRGLSRSYAIMIPFVLTGVVIFIAIFSIVPLITSQASALEARLPKYQSDLLNLISSSERWFQKYFKVDIFLLYISGNCIKFYTYC